MSQGGEEYPTYH